jgi:DNA replication protein DnaC
LTVKAREYALNVGISDEREIESNLLMLLEAAEAERVCLDCPGIDRCVYDGYFPVVKVDLYPARALRQCELSRRRQGEIRRQRLLLSARIPDIFREKTFDTFRLNADNRDAFREAVRVAKEPDGKGLLLAGNNTGTGKTHLAVAILNERIKTRCEGLFCTVPELMADIKRTFGRNDDTSELIELVKGVELLILDDLGAEKSSEWATEQLFVIINARLLKRKQTVVTTNFTVKELIDKLGGLSGQRIVSRLCEMCVFKRLEGEDWRMKL